MDGRKPAEQVGEPKRIEASEGREPMERAAELALEYLEGVRERPVKATATVEELRTALRKPFGEEGEDPKRVIEELAAAVEPGLIASAGPRYFGFVIGGSYPVAVAADWLTSAWDQNAGLYVSSPAAAVVEEVAGRWMIDLFGLPETTSVGFTTGAGASNAVAVMAARHALLAREGWDVERQGLYGAPEITVLIGDEAHITVPVALQYAGLGSERVVRVTADSAGRMRPDALADALAKVRGPALVCAQAGNVNTGAFDPLDAIADACSSHGAWLHVDGAFGLWAAASPSFAGLLAGVDRADSWSTDAHKWLNVPYDGGVVFVRDPAAHRAAMTSTASYYVQTAGGERDPFEYVLDNSRRARAFPVYAVLRTLGRSGVRELIERCCRLGRLMAERLSAEPGVEVLNDVVLNQVLVRRLGRDDQRRHPPGPRGRRGLARRHHLAREARDAGVGLKLDDVREGHRAQRTGNRRSVSRRSRDDLDESLRDGEDAVFRDAIT
jgi:glutamate/tyrosine decarboxylase-like PLP-dependent enzyme